MHTRTDHLGSRTKEEDEQDRFLRDKRAAMMARKASEAAGNVRRLLSFERRPKNRRKERASGEVDAAAHAGDARKVALARDKGEHPQFTSSPVQEEAKYVSPAMEIARQRDMGKVVQPELLKAVEMIE